MIPHNSATTWRRLRSEDDSKVCSQIQTDESAIVEQRTSGATDYRIFGCDLSPVLVQVAVRVPAWEASLAGRSPIAEAVPG